MENHLEGNQGDPPSCNSIDCFFVEMIGTLWDERNKSMFQGRRSCTPVRVILQNACFTGCAYMEEISNQKKLAWFKVGLEALTEATNKLLLFLDLNDGAH